VIAIYVGRLFRFFNYWCRDSRPAPVFLTPAKHIISHSGASSNRSLAKLLRPQSLNEIGYLVKILGNVFKPLVEQESHVTAIIDHAAQGITVLDEEHAIGTFNPAAEHLFG